MHNASPPPWLDLNGALVPMRHLASAAFDGGKVDADVWYAAETFHNSVCRAYARHFPEVLEHLNPT